MNDLILLNIIGIGTILWMLWVFFRGMFGGGLQEISEEVPPSNDNVTVEDMILHDMQNQQDEWDLGEINFND
jgi:hypothetical protein